MDHSRTQASNLRFTALGIVVTMFFAFAVHGPGSVGAKPPTETANRKTRSFDELREILVNQPDFAATAYGCNRARGSGFGETGRLFRRGGVYRIEVSPKLFEVGPRGVLSITQTAWLVEIGKTRNDDSVVTALVPSQRSYFNDGDGYGDGLILSLFSHPYVFLVSSQWWERLCGLRDAGDEAVEGIECTKIEAATRDRQVVVFYVAKSLDNLIVRVVVREYPQLEMGMPFQSLDFSGAVFQLRDVTLDPPADLFSVPKDYHRISVPELFAEMRDSPSDSPRGPNRECPPSSNAGDLSWKALCTIPEPVPVNKPPICGGIKADRTTIAVGESCFLEADAVDPDGDFLGYAWSTSGGHLVHRGSGVLFDSTGLVPGVYVVTVAVLDGQGHSVECELKITISARN